MKQKKLTELFDDYIQICEYSLRRRPVTIESYRNSFRLLRELLPDLTYPQHLSESKLNEFFKILQTRKRKAGKRTDVVGVKNSTIATHWSKLSPFFIWLESNKYIDKSPFKYMRKPDVEYENKPALKKKQIEKIYSSILLNSSSTFMLKRDTAIVSILFFTGVRRTELISLHVRDIDIEKSIITIKGKTSKSKRTRKIPINPTLKVHLQDYLNQRKKYPEEHLLISERKGTPLSVHGMRHWVKRIKAISGVNFHLHQLRHTFACNLARNNISLPKLQKLLGHIDLRMTERYVRSLGVEHLVDDILKLSLDDSY